MVLIVTALRIEAAPFIDYYKLKRDMSSKKHELYKSSDSSVTLLITRAGKLPAAIALTEYLTANAITHKDYMINIGICGSVLSKSRPSVYLCSSIYDHDTKKLYYPDLLLKSPFNVASLETFSLPVTKANYSEVSADLVDMEAAALFEAGIHHFSTDRMCFLKIPSDMLEPEKVNMDDVTKLINKTTLLITDWLNTLIKAAPDAVSTDTALTCEDLLLLDTISEELHLSVTMKEQLKQLFTYKKLKDGDITIDFSIPEGTKTNQKRKILFEQLREQFL